MYIICDWDFPLQPERNMKLKNWITNAIDELQNSDDFAETFVEKRLELSRTYLKDKVLSTSHGADIFENILKCLSGEEWKEQGVYGDNFRKLIKENQ